MMKSVATLVRAAAACLLLAGASTAATFDINTASLGAGGSGATATCSSFPGDTTCNFTIGLASGIPSSVIVAPGSSTTFNFLQFTSRQGLVLGNDFFFPDSAVITATLRFLNPLATFTVPGSGSNIANFVGTFVGGSLVWTTPPSQFFAGIGNVSVVLTPRSVGPFAGSLIGPNNFNVEATISVDTSVVPLPGGVLLLGSALLGLIGLSRRRKFAAA